jgi:hypothetical protein
MASTGTRGGGSNTDVGWGRWRRHRSMVAHVEREHRGEALRVDSMGEGLVCGKKRGGSVRMGSRALGFSWPCLREPAAGRMLSIGR